MRFIEEEHQLRLIEIADFRQGFEQFAEQPEQEAGIQTGLQDELVGGQQIDHAPAGGMPLHDVGQLQCRLTEEMLAALLLQTQQRALDGGDRSRRDQTVSAGNIGFVFGNMVEDRAQVFQIQQQQAIVIGQFEGDVEYAGLGFIELEHAREKIGAELGYRGPHRMAFFSEQIPERDRAGFVGVIGNADVGDTRLDFFIHGSGDGQPRDVAFDIGHEHRHAHARKAFGQHHQGNRFPGTGGAGHQAVAVAVFGEQGNLLFALADQDVAHGLFSKIRVSPDCSILRVFSTFMPSNALPSKFLLTPT